jgi:protein gp37
VGTKIEWTDTVWNPITGCTPISAGCEKCYAKRMANRLRGRFGYPEKEPFNIAIHKDRFNDPINLRGNKKIFVCSMSDLFHKDVPYEAIRTMFQIMAYCKNHTFQILTKRPDRTKDIIDGFIREGDFTDISGTPVKFPINNVWFGVTAENQEMADVRIPILLQIPATVRFVSCEPMLGRIDLTKIHYDNTVEINSLTGDHGVIRPLAGKSDNKLHWVICGPETGPGARPMEMLWMEFLYMQCWKNETPFFDKKNALKLDVQQFPKAS